MHSASIERHDAWVVLANANSSGGEMKERMISYGIGV